MQPVDEEIVAKRDAEVRQYLGRMLQNRRGRRRLAKIDRMIKHWPEHLDMYAAVNKPKDLGINKFKKLARERLDKPNRIVLNYKVEMYKTFLNKVKEAQSVKV